MNDQSHKRAINWELIIVASIAALAPSLLALATLIQATKTHDIVNSRMSELLELTRQQAADRATLVEKAAEHKREVEKESPR